MSLKKSFQKSKIDNFQKLVDATQGSLTAFISANVKTSPAEDYFNDLTKTLESSRDRQVAITKDAWKQVAALGKARTELKKLQAEYAKMQAEAAKDKEEPLPGWLMALSNFGTASALQGGAALSVGTAMKYDPIADQKRKLEELRKKVKESDGDFSAMEENWRPCLLYTSPSPRDRAGARMPASA